MGQQTDAIQRKLKALLAEMEGAASAALYQEGLAIDALSVKKTPVDTGRLRATHYCSPPMRRGKRVVIEVGNGTEYAIHVHERTELRHKTGEAKFLQNAMNARIPGMLERLAARTRANFKRGVNAAVLDPLVPGSPKDIDIGKQYAPTRRTFEAMKMSKRRTARRDRVRAKRKEQKLARVMANGRKRAEQRRAKAEKKAVRNAERKATKSANRAAKKQRAKQAKAAKAYSARWKAAEKAHAKKSRTGWKNKRRKFRKRR